MQWSKGKYNTQLRWTMKKKRLKMMFRTFLKQNSKPTPFSLTTCNDTCTAMQTVLPSSLISVSWYIFLYLVLLKLLLYVGIIISTLSSPELRGPSKAHAVPHLLLFKQSCIRFSQLRKWLRKKATAAAARELTPHTISTNWKVLAVHHHMHHRRTWIQCLKAQSHLA